MVIPIYKVLPYFVISASLLVYQPYITEVGQGVREREGREGRRKMGRRCGGVSHQSPNKILIVGGYEGIPLSSLSLKCDIVEECTVVHV